MKHKTYIQSATKATASALLVLAAGSTAHADISIPNLPGSSGGSTVPSLIESTLNILTWAIGVIAVIMVIVGGLQYVLSAGDPGKATRAKDTILYAVIGVVVTIMAYSIVKFIIGSVK